MEPLRLLSLFAGIGGFELGLERSGGFRTVAQCEIDSFCRQVLARHWPDVRRYEDVRELSAARLAADGIAVDAICGGFPCQDISLSGRLAGIGSQTRSGLWSEFARLVGEIRPRVVFVENVTNLLSGPPGRPGGWFGRVLGDLAALGYDAEWHCITAASIGAPHERDRVWLVANPHEAQFQGGGISSRIYQEHANSGNSCWGKDKPGVERTLDGLPKQMDRVGALGNAVVPQIPELLGKAYIAAMRDMESV